MSSFEDTLSELSSTEDGSIQFKKDEAQFRTAFKNFREASCEMQEVFKEFQDFNNRTNRLEAEFKFLGHIQEFLRTDDPSRFLPVIHEREDGPRLNDGWWSHFDYTPTPDSIDNINRIGISIEKLLGSFFQDSEDSDYYSDLSSQSTPSGDNSRKENEDMQGGNKWKLKLHDMKQRYRGNAAPAVRLNQLTAARHEYIQEKRCKSAGNSQKPIRLPRMDICDNMPLEDMTESLLDAIGPVRFSSDDDLLSQPFDDPVKLPPEEKHIMDEIEDEPVRDDSSWISISCRSTPEPKARNARFRNLLPTKEKESKEMLSRHLNNYLRPNSGKSSKSSSLRRTPSSTPDSLRHELSNGRFSPAPVPKPKYNSRRSSPALSPRHMVFGRDLEFKKGFVHCPKPHRRKCSQEENLIMWDQSQMEPILGHLY